jgi:predicted PurR-regulated permease PerM
MAGAVLLLWFIYRLGDIFGPLLIALVLAQIFNPLVTYLEDRWRWPRVLSTALLLGVFVLSFVVFLAWLGPLLFEQGNALARRMPEYVRAIATAYNLEVSELSNRFAESLGGLQFEPQQVLAQIFQSTGRALGIVTTVLGAAAYLLFWLALVLVGFFFFCWHFNSGLEHLQSYIPRSRKARALEICSRMDDAIGQFFRGRLVVSIIMGVLLSAGWFAAGVPYWFVLGMLTGLLNIVPYLSTVTWPIAIIIKYVDALTGGGETMDFVSIAVWPSAVYAAVQLLENWVLTPLIQSGSTNLSAFTVIVVVFVGASLGGVMGMLFAIPVASCSKILLDQVALPRLRRWAAEH